jgi:hypothetical protein
MMMPLPAMQLPAAMGVLLAAGFDWLEALLPFLFVVFWILSQVFAVFRRMQQGGGQKPPPPLPRFDPARDRPQGPRPPAEDAALPRSDLEKQIAEFLREATGETKRRPVTIKSEPATAPRPQPTRATSRPGSERVGQQQPQSSQRPQSPQRSQSSQRSQGSEDARREQRQKPPSVAARESAATRADVAMREGNATRAGMDANASVARHVKDAFSQELAHLKGELAEDAPKAGTPPATAATQQMDELVQMLRNPATIRQAVLLREVLDRPVERW